MEREGREGKGERRGRTGNLRFSLDLQPIRESRRRREGRERWEGGREKERKRERGEGEREREKEREENHT